MNRECGRRDRAYKRADIAVLVIFTVFFFAILMIWGVPTYNDSDQYLSMHIRREPIYPIFLFIIRQIFNKFFFTAVGVIQTIINIYASYRFVTYISREFKLKAWGEFLVCIIVLAPFIITPLVSVTSVKLSSGIMSEALAMPLCLLFVIHMHRVCRISILFEHEAKHEPGYKPEYNSDFEPESEYIISFFLALVLSLIRSNLMVLLIVWLIICAANLIIARRWKVALVIALLFIMAFPIRGVVTKGYNYVFNDRYIGNAYTKLTVLTNIFYVTDRSRGEEIEDEELREIFYTLYDEMDERGWSYVYGGDTVSERAIYLEEVHDRIKFEVLEYGLRDIIEARGIHDYIDYNLIAEEYCGRLIPILIKGAALKWFGDFVIMGLRGVVRSIAVCSMIAYVYTAIVGVCAILSIIYFFKKGKEQANDLYISAAWLMIISSLLILGNAFGTAALIMCLSRYMVYGFAPFYTAALVMICDKPRFDR